jgi:hypothetical protein
MILWLQISQLTGWNIAELSSEIVGQLYRENSLHGLRVTMRVTLNVFLLLSTRGLAFHTLARKHSNLKDVPWILYCFASFSPISDVATSNHPWCLAHGHIPYQLSFFWIGASKIIFTGMSAVRTVDLFGIGQVVRSWDRHMMTFLIRSTILATDKYRI